jgi:hypothetical protein
MKKNTTLIQWMVLLTITAILFLFTGNNYEGFIPKSVAGEISRPSLLLQPVKLVVDLFSVLSYFTVIILLIKKLSVKEKKKLEKLNKWINIALIILALGAVFSIIYGNLYPHYNIIPNV